MTTTDGSPVDLTHLEPAAQTASVTKFYYYHSHQRKVQARAALRAMTACNNDSVPLYRREDGSADVILERLWNILAGND
jgi:hypothetical protein